jgi:uncharacterized membrane protein
MLILSTLSLAVGIIGILVISWGVLLSCITFVRLEYKGLKTLSKDKQHTARMHLRQSLGAYILLGLEFMIAGDIVHTVLKPTQDSLIVLGSIVVIRTLISFFLNRELKVKIG